MHLRTFRFLIFEKKKKKFLSLNRDLRLDLNRPAALRFQRKTIEKHRGAGRRSRVLGGAGVQKTGKGEFGLTAGVMGEVMWFNSERWQTSTDAQAETSEERVSH